jgi:hypothetical protein
LPKAGPIRRSQTCRFECHPGDAWMLVGMRRERDQDVAGASHDQFRPEVMSRARTKIANCGCRSIVPSRGSAFRGRNDFRWKSRVPRRAALSRSYRPSKLSELASKQSSKSAGNLRWRPRCLRTRSANHSSSRLRNTPRWSFPHRPQDCQLLIPLTPRSNGVLFMLPTSGLTCCWRRDGWHD